MAGIDNNTVLYLRGDSFNDLSLNPKNVTNNGVSIDNNCFKFGASKRLVIDDNSAFAFGIGDFTVEMDIYLTSYSDADLFVSNNSYKDFYFSVHNSGRMRFDVIAGTVVQYGNELVSLNQWNNVCVVRKDGLSYLFLNGHLQGEPYSNTGNVAMTSPAIGYHNAYSTSDKIEGNVKNIRVSNIARYTEDFTPPTKPYNSITINKTNQTDTNIEFNIEKLGQETINKVEVLVNGTVSETYIDNYDSVNYLIDTELCVLGNNYITIRVAYDDNYTEEEVITYKYAVTPLPQETPLLDTVERVKLLTELKQNEKTMLSSILTSKNVEVSEEDKMSDLIDKVDLLGVYDNHILWLYKFGNEYVDVTGGWFFRDTWEAGGVSKEGIKNSDNLQVNTTYDCAGFIADSIDFTNYSKLKVDYEIVKNTDTSKLMVIVKDAYPYNSTKLAYIEASDIKRGTLELNISSINGVHKLSCESYTGTTSSGQLSFKIYNIWLEK